MNTIRFIKCTCIRSVLLLLIFTGLFSPVYSQEVIKIGVLAYRGEAECLNSWTATSDYLSSEIKEYNFKIVPLGFEQMKPAIESASIDFIICNPANYVEYEVLYKVSRIGTMVKQCESEKYKVFGSVIFCLADRNDLSHIFDFKEKSMIAVDDLSFGGYLMAKVELQKNNINIEKGLSGFSFAGTHDSVVYAVKNKIADIGIIRTGIFESLQKQDKIDTSDFKIINRKYFDDFHLITSTSLFPEWPISKIKETPDSVAVKVIQTLYNLKPDNPACIAAEISGWTIPSQYQSVRYVLQDLKASPYKNFGEITLREAIIHNLEWVIAIIISFILLLISLLIILKLNRKKTAINEKLKDASHELETKVNERTAELLKAKQEWEDIFNTIGQPALIISPDHDVMHVNNSMLRLFNGNFESIKGKKCYEIFNNISGPPDNCPLLKSLNTKEFVESAIEIKSLEKQFIVSCTPNFDIQNKIEKFIHIMTDITEQKLSEKKLFESEKKYTELLKSAPDSIIILDNEGKITDVNDQTKTIFGYEKEELIGQSIEKLIHKNIHKTHLEKRKNFISNPSNISLGSGKGIPALCKNGETIYVEINISPFHSNGNLCLTAIIRDVTDRKKSEEELKKHRDNLEDLIKERTQELEDAQNAMISILEDVNESNESLNEANIKLQELDKLKSMFIASMSHELRTPLNSIIGFSGILLMGLAGDLNKEQTKQLTFLKSSASHLLTLITDIIDLSKIEAGKMELEIEQVDLKEIVNDAIQIMKPLANNKSLELNVDGFENIQLETDGRRIKQVIVNLLGNAVKFTEKGSVTVQIKKGKKELVISVIDTGMGISKDDQEKLFTAFTKIRAKDGPLYEGTGLGLYLSKKIIEKLNGKIWVESDPDSYREEKGSVFAFSLPIK